MALEDIIKKIENEAKNQVKEIEQERDRIIFNLKENGDKELTKRKKEILDEAEKKSKRLIEKARFAIQGESHDKITEKKLKAVADLYLKVMAELQNLSKSDYLKLVQSFLDKSPQNRNYEIFVAKNREAEIREFFASKGLKTVGTIDSRGGFIIKAKEIEIDNTFEAIVNQLKKEAEIEVAKILFN